MGNPMNGEMYEGLLRPGDVGIEAEEIDRFKSLALKDRMTEFQQRFREQGEAHAADISGVAREMPKYRCHKEVWALKIRSIGPNTADGSEITPEEEGYAPFSVDAAFIAHHKPEVGGYFVVYKDGYKSYSPAQAFEEGYTRI